MNERAPDEVDDHAREVEDMEEFLGEVDKYLADAELNFYDSNDEGNEEDDDEQDGEGVEEGEEAVGTAADTEGAVIDSAAKINFKDPKSWECLMPSLKGKGGDGGLTYVSTIPCTSRLIFPTCQARAVPIDRTA